MRIFDATLWANFLCEKNFDFRCNIVLAWVTLYRLGDPLVFSHAPRATAAPPRGHCCGHERMASAHVCQGACLGALVHGAGTCPSANAGGSAFDAGSPAVRFAAVGNGQAGNLELNAVDSCGVHWIGALGGIVQDLGR